MKKGILIVCIVGCTALLHAQSKVIFANSSYTLVTFGNTASQYGLTPGVAVPVGQFYAELYYHPGTDPSQDPGDAAMTGGQMGPAVLSGLAPGRFSGGIRTTPTATAPNERAWFQVVAWESAFGSTYEQAINAPPMDVGGGVVRRAFAGRSNRFNMPTAAPPAAAEPIAIIDGTRLHAFAVDVVPGNPYFSVSDLAVSEGSNGTVYAAFIVSVNASTNPAATFSVDFATADGTALAGQDYVSTNGTLAFSAGETQKVVSVAITADAPPESEETFFLDLSNPVNAFAGKTRGTCVITEVRIAGISADILVSFNTISNRYYVLERSANMATWTAVAGAENVRGTGDIVTAADRGAGCASGLFYRARLLP